MNEVLRHSHEQPEYNSHIEELDSKIYELIQSLERKGIDVTFWNHRYETLGENLDEFREFYDLLMNFNDKREDALSTFEFRADITDIERQSIRRFDQEVRRAYKDHENFLGNGATAEVYAMSNNDIICVKFITNQERYDENNHMRTEYELLSKVYEASKSNRVRTPYPIFLRIHVTDGHAYGMEKIKGASLSQILEFPEKYTNLVNVAKRLNIEEMEKDLEDFVDCMHKVGITHGDLFKRNIMMDDNGKLYVIDFGKAKNNYTVDENEDKKSSDRYLARQSLREFVAQINTLTNIDK